jgi:hypothetical protein
VNDPYLRTYTTDIEEVPDELRDLIVADVETFIRAGGVPTWSEWSGMSPITRDAWARAIVGIETELEDVDEPMPAPRVVPSGKIRRACKEMAGRLVAQ